MHPTRRRRRVWTFVLALGLVLSGLGSAVGPAPSASATETTSCQPVRIPVAVVGGAGDIAGTLCGPRGAHVLQVLVHGFTYAQYYWDLPYQPEKYSYVKRAEAAGLATLNIDRIGTGDSFHPPSATLTYDNHADAVHQVIQAARRGQLGRTFDKVVIVGHSLGSVITYLEAGKYRDVDGVIVTAAGHKVSFPSLITAVGPNTIPAALDPKYRNAGYDPGYMTTRPGSRGVFYEAANTDPAVIALDEKLKGTGNEIELLTATTYLTGRGSRDINVPVLTVNGSKDPFFCSAGASDCSSSQALAAQERPNFGPRATSEALVIPGGGHDVSLERTATRAHDRMIDFVVGHFGR